MLEQLHPSFFMLAEMAARNWSFRDVATRMDGNPQINEVALQMWAEVGPSDRRCKYGDHSGLATAFGTSVEFWDNLEAQWQHSQNKEPADG